MDTVRRNITIERLRRYSSAFSRSVFSEIIEFEDFSHINWLLSLENNQENFKTYREYFIYLYSWLKKEYRCEYFFKNEIITKHLIQKIGTKDSIIFNEFKVGESIVDLAMMNGESKAFEIKTDFDTPKRLLKQLEDYHSIFNQVYLVTSKERVFQYLELIPDYIGILTLEVKRNQVYIVTLREAISNFDIDSEKLIACLRSSEYKNIVLEYFGGLPHTKNGDMYLACLESFSKIPKKELNELFLKEIKKRKNITSFLSIIPREFRQMCLSLNLSKKKISTLFNQLNKPINFRPICISRI